MFFKRIQKEQSDLLRSKGLQAFLSFLTHPSAGSSHRPQCCMGPQLLLCSPEAREKLQGCSPESLGVSSPPAPTAAPTSSSWTQGPMRNVVVMLSWTGQMSSLGCASIPPTAQEPRALLGKRLTRHHRYPLSSFLA